MYNSIKKQHIFQFLFVFVVVVLINYITSFIIFRFDLTSEGRYTLSAKTKTLLESIDDQVHIKIYLEGDDLPVGFKKMRTALIDMLEEFNYYSASNISYRFINPGENPDKKARFGLYKELYDKGLVPIETQEISEEGKTSQKLVFPCIVVVYKGKDIGVNLLKTDARYRFDSDENINNSIQSLEYEISNAIRKLNIERKPEIAFIEGHGEAGEYDVMDITRVLSEYYDVKRGSINQTPGIIDSFAAIIIAGPEKKFSEEDKLIIDQYIMKGGKVLWLLEGAKIAVDSLRSLPTTVAMPLELNLEDMLFRYGVRVNPGLLQDMQCAPIGLTRKTTDEKPRIDLYPWPYFPVIVSNNSHEINRYLNLIRFEFCSTLDTLGSSPEVRKTVLLWTSDKARFDYAPVQVSIDNIQEQLNESKFVSKNLPVAILLEGNFESNFKNRLLQNFVIPREQIKSISEPTKMIIISDADFACNIVSPKGEVYPVGFDINTQKTYQGNKDIILNAVNYLCDDEGLMSIRLREIQMRLLSKDKIIKQRLRWKSINTILPVLLVAIFALLSWYTRKMKYTKTL